MKNKCIISVIVVSIIIMTGCSVIRFKGNDIAVYSTKHSNGTEYLVLNKDHTFSVRDSYGYEWYGGEWHQDGDTLIMISDAYRKPFKDLDTMTQKVVEQYCMHGKLPSLIPEDDPYHPFVDTAYRWYFKPKANAGDRQLYFVDGRCLKDAIPDNDFIDNGHGTCKIYYLVPQACVFRCRQGSLWADRPTDRDRQGQGVLF